MDERGVITAHGPFQGLDRFEARSADRRARCASEGRIVAEKRPYVHSVGHCSRCKTTIEPRLSHAVVGQGRAAGARPPATRSATAGSTIHPAGDGEAVLRLGRQHARLVHLAPAVVGPPHPGLVRAGRRGRLRRPRRGAADRRGLDARTPTSSTPGSPPACGRSPRSAGPSRPPDLAKFYPNRVLLTGYDIIFFWVARMMMFGLYAMDGDAAVPHHRAHGLVRDEFGKKMSKSFGNAVDPLDWMDTYGSDARALHPGRAAPTPAPTCRSARTGSRAPATSPTRSGTPPASR